jgi:hypothetical protein
MACLNDNEADYTITCNSENDTSEFLEKTSYETIEQANEELIHNSAVSTAPKSMVRSTRIRSGRHSILVQLELDGHNSHFTTC